MEWEFAQDHCSRMAASEEWSGEEGDTGSPDQLGQVHSMGEDKEKDEEEVEEREEGS